MAEVSIDTSGQVGFGTTDKVTLAIGSNYNRCIFAAVLWFSSSGKDVQSITHDGNAMTQIGNIKTCGNTHMRTYYYLNPDTGAGKETEVVMTGGANCVLLVASAYNVDQDTPNDARDDQDGGDATAESNVATGGINDMVLDFCTLDSDGVDTTITEAGEATQLQNLEYAAIDGSMSWSRDAIDVNLLYNLSHARSWMLVAFNINYVAPTERSNRGAMWFF